MTLTEFLTARLDEDEALARSALSPLDEAPMHTVGCGYDQIEFGAECHCLGPARVLAEVAAKRAILRAYNARSFFGQQTVDDVERQRGLLVALCALATVYAAHSDYQSEWTSLAGASVD